MLSYDYAARRAVLDDPAALELSPHLYVLCRGCAAKLTPPQGWSLEDTRSQPPLFLAGERGSRIDPGHPDHRGSEEDGRLSYGGRA